MGRKTLAKNKLAHTESYSQQNRNPSRKKITHNVIKIISKTLS